MKLLVGLGNPGKQYERNRHNIGFMAVDAIARMHGFAPWRSRFKGEVAEGRFGSEKCLLLKPTTYMNLSGEAVREAAQFYKIDLADIFVCHDEIDLKPGKIKVKAGGGNAGHNGLKSISAHMGNDYTRVRLGVGRPQMREDVARYVLQDFAKAEQAWLDELIDALARRIDVLVLGEPDRFMSLIGQDLLPIAPSPSQQKTDGKESTAKRADTTDAKTAQRAKQPDKGGPLKAALENWFHKNKGNGES